MFKDKSRVANVPFGFENVADWRLSMYYKPRFVKNAC